MSYRINGTDIELTRGDTFRARVDIFNVDGSEYIPNVNDKLRFAMKENYYDTTPVLLISIPINTRILEIKPNDTKELHFGKYVYDIELTKANGDVDTFITKARIRLREEVY